jgi:O-methyltransferase involved in polyketide biosynthesis
MANEAISPTAHYTGYVWARNGLSHPLLRTAEGRVLYESMRPLNLITGRVLGVSLEPYLLARHRAIDARLHAAIESGTVSQVIEVASGLSPRGWRFTGEYGDRITYLETDLPGMASRKRDALEQIGALGEHHRVYELDALRDDGPDSLAEVASTLDPSRGVAIITEGLLSYLGTDAVMGIWTRFATALHGFPEGRYISDLHLRDLQQAYVKVFRLALSGFVRGSVSLHFDDEADAEVALLDCGFDVAAVLRASGEEIGAGTGGRHVHIIEASTSRSQ